MKFVLSGRLDIHRYISNLKENLYAQYQSLKQYIPNRHTLFHASVKIHYALFIASLINSVNRCFGIPHRIASRPKLRTVDRI